MSKLFQVTAIQHNTTVFNPPSTMLLNPVLVVRAPSTLYTDADGVEQAGTQITYNINQNTMPHIFVVSEPPSTLYPLINDAVTDDVHQIQLNEIAFGAPDTDYIPPAQLSVIDVNVKDIWLAQEYPNNNNQTSMVIQNQVRTTPRTIRIMETLAEVLALANDNS